MSKYFKPYNTEEDPTYPEDVRYIRTELESEYGTVECSNLKLGELWRDFSDTYHASFLNPDDQFIKEFASWLEAQERGKRNER